MIGAGNDQDAVAGIVIYNDGGRSRSVMTVRQDMGSVNSMLSIIMDRAFSKHVTADFSDDGRLRAQSGRHHRLVGALAAETEVKRLAGEGFSWLG